MITRLRRNATLIGSLLSLCTLSIWLPVVATATAEPKPHTIYSKLAYHHLPSLQPNEEQPNVSPVTRKINEYNRLHMVYNLFDQLERERGNLHEKNPILSDFSWDDLELVMGEQDRSQHLYGKLNRTHTTMGKVQLQDWLVKPTDCIDTIKHRQQLIEYLANNDEVLDDLDAQLAAIAANENSVLSFWDKNDHRQLALRHVVEPEVDENVQKLLDAEKNFFEKIAAPFIKLFKKKTKLRKDRIFSTNSTALHTKSALSTIWNFKGAIILTVIKAALYGEISGKLVEAKRVAKQYYQKAAQEHNQPITENGGAISDPYKALTNSKYLRNQVESNLSANGESMNTWVATVDQYLRDHPDPNAFYPNQLLTRRERREINLNSSRKDKEKLILRKVKDAIREAVATRVPEANRTVRLAGEDIQVDQYQPINYQFEELLLPGRNLYALTKKNYAGYAGDVKSSQFFIPAAMRYLWYDLTHPGSTLKNAVKFFPRLIKEFKRSGSKGGFIAMQGTLLFMDILWIYFLYSSFKQFKERRELTYLVQNISRNCGQLLNDAEKLFNSCQDHQLLASALPHLDKTNQDLCLQTSSNKQLKRMRSLFDSSAVRAKHAFRYFTTPIGKVYASYNQMRNHKKEVTPTLQLIGNVDALVSMAKLYKEMKGKKNSFCMVQLEKADTPHLKLEGVWNPMLDPQRAVPSDIELGNNVTAKNAIISGPNAGGKSTVMKAITLSIVLAQTFGIAPARQMILTPFSGINTYLNIKDDIAQGRSKFKMEAYRANDLINRIELDKKSKIFSMMDETFSSTDHREGAAAAYSIFRYLTEHAPQSMTIAASHFPLLKRLEAHTNGAAKNFMIKATVDPISYPFKLYEGASNQVIAIDLLKEEGLDIEKELQYARDVLANPEFYL